MGRPPRPEGLQGVRAGGDRREAGAHVTEGLRDDGGLGAGAVARGPERRGGGLWLGAFSDAQRKDCDGGKRVQAALAKESAPAVAWRLANAWHQFVRRCPEQDRDFQAFVGNRAFAVVEARRVVVSDLAPEVLARPGWFETLATVVYDLRDDPDVRESAPKAFKNLPPERKRAGAAILRGLLGERAPERTVPRPLPGPDLAEQAAMTLASMQADEGFADVVEAARRELAAGGSGRGSCRRSTST